MAQLWLAVCTASSEIQFSLGFTHNLNLRPLKLLQVDSWKRQPSLSLKGGDDPPTQVHGHREGVRRWPKAVFEVAEQPRLFGRKPAYFRRLSHIIGSHECHSSLINVHARDANWLIFKSPVFVIFGAQAELEDDRVWAMTNAAYLVDGLRTPIGRLGGALCGVRADDLAAHVISQIVERTGVPGAELDDVIFGCANQAGEDNRNVARMGALLAGLPVEVAGVTVNRLCGSGLQAFNDAARLIMLGEAELIIAGGVEQMSRAPWVMPKTDKPYPRGNQTLFDTMLGWRMINKRMEEMHGTLGLGLTAERVAERYKVSREAQDQLAAQSQKRAADAMAAGRFDREIVAIQTGVDRKSKEAIIVSNDEHPRPGVDAAKLAKLRPVFDANGTVTAGNASGINDGACAMLVASEAAVKKYNLKPLARYVTSAVAGVEPNYMGLGPIPSSKKAFAKAGLSAKDMSLSEVNEAFAAQAVPCIEQLELDPETVNVNGGAIALGHPLGATGARLVVTLAHEMAARPGRYGLASMCIGVGQGIATIIEKA